MSSHTQVPSRASAAASMACWASSFPVVARLWRELFNELLRSSLPESRNRRAADPRSRDSYAVAAQHDGGSEPSVRNAQGKLPLSHPASLPPQPGTHAAGPVPPAGRTFLSKTCPDHRNGSRSNRAPNCTSAASSCAWLVELAEFA
jgi:hypothetical protein